VGYCEEAGGTLAELLYLYEQGSPSHAIRTPPKLLLRNLRVRQRVEHVVCLCVRVYACVRERESVCE